MKIYNPFRLLFFVLYTLWMIITFIPKALYMAWDAFWSWQAFKHLCEDIEKHGIDAKKVINNKLGDAILADFVANKLTHEQALKSVINLNAMNSNKLLSKRVGLEP